MLLRNVEMESIAVAMLDDEVTVQNSKGEIRHGEELHRRDDFPMIAQKRSPADAFGYTAAVEAS